MERRAHHDHETDQLATLLGLAAAGVGVTSVSETVEGGDASRPAPPVEMILDGRRLQAGRMPRMSLAKLRDAMGNIAAVPLTAVGRYGPYWVLTFRLATEQLVILAEHLTLMPDWSGGGGREMVSAGPLSTLGI
jgi:hypothetical protein